MAKQVGNSDLGPLGSCQPTQLCPLSFNRTGHFLLLISSNWKWYILQDPTIIKVLSPIGESINSLWFDPF